MDRRIKKTNIAPKIRAALSCPGADLLKVVMFPTAINSEIIAKTAKEFFKILVVFMFFCFLIGGLNHPFSKKN